MAEALRVALLGAESTGKSTLARALAEHLREPCGLRVVVVGEVLREWCAQAGRTPQPEEQWPIAQEQERRVDAAAAQGHDVVIADTTALMVATYSAMLFEDAGLYRFALERQHRYALTLLTGLDLPWVPDGLQRDGPQVREPVDALVRTALARAGACWSVVYGQGPARLHSALAALAPHLPALAQTLAPPPSAASAWLCEQCSDPACEHRLFTRLLPRAASSQK